MKIKELEKLVLEALINEIGPSMAAKAVKPALMKKDPRTATILRDAVISMFSKYIGKKLPFNFIARTEGHPVEYELIEVVSKISFNDPRVEFHFYNPEGVESDAPFALNKKNIVVIYDIKEDELKDSKSGRFHWILNPFTSKFFTKAANDIRKMYYTAMPETILQPKEDSPWEDEFVIDKDFKMKSKINKNDFNEFAYDSQAMSLNEGVDTGNPYDLNNPSNLDDFYRKVVDVWTEYCGQRSNDAGVSNDNRVILYNLLESGKLAERINQMWSPNGLHQDKNGTDFYTNNPEDMEAHLQKMGYSKGDYTLSPGVASQGRFEQPYTNPETTMSLNEGILSNIKDKFMDKLSSLPALDSLADAIVKNMSPEDMSNFKSQVSGGVSESEGQKEFKAPKIDDIMGMVSGELSETSLNESEDEEALAKKWNEWEKEQGVPSTEEINKIVSKVNNLSRFGTEGEEKAKAEEELRKIKDIIKERERLEKEEKKALRTIPQKIAGIVRKAAGINLVSLAGAPLAAFVTASLGLGLLAFPFVAVAGLIASVIIYAVAKKIEGYEGSDMLGEMSEKESLKESIRQVVRDAMFGNKKNKGLIKKIEDLQGTKIDQRVDRVIYSNEELNNMSSDELVSLFSHMSHPRGRNW